MKRYYIIIFFSFWSLIAACTPGKLGIQNDTDAFMYVSFYKHGIPMWFTVPGTQFNLRHKQMMIGAIDRVSNITYCYGPERQRHYVDITKIPHDMNALIKVHGNGVYTIYTLQQ